MTHSNEYIDCNFDPPYIDNDQNNLIQYVHHLTSFTPKNKAIDLGRTALAIATVQNTPLNADNFHLKDDFDELSAEANNRFLAHVIHLKETNNLEIVNNEVAQNINNYIVDIAVHSSSEVFPDEDSVKELSDEELYFQLGIKCVEKISQYILD